jgi:hypothetical protein
MATSEDAVGMDRKSVLEPPTVGATPSGDYIIWALFCELRKEVLESQKTRAQVIGFKITLLGTSIGVIVAALESVPMQLLMIPAFAAVFFDLLINSYSVGIKRIGAYVGDVLEPKLKEASNWPADLPMWEQYMSLRSNKQNYSLVGNLGITLLAAVPAIIALFKPFKLGVSVPLLVAYLPLLAYDCQAFLRPRKLVDRPSSAVVPLDGAMPGAPGAPGMAPSRRPSAQGRP